MNCLSIFVLTAVNFFEKAAVILGGKILNWKKRSAIPRHSEISNILAIKICKRPRHSRLREVLVLRIFNS